MIHGVNYLKIKNIRLMSSKEYVEQLGYNIVSLKWVLLNAIKINKYHHPETYIDICRNQVQ